MENKRKSKNDVRLFIIALILFVNVTGNGLILPLLPYIAENLGASPLVIGIFISTYPFFSMLAGPYLGTLSDKYGRKPILLISIAGTIIGFLMLGLANSLPVLFLARIIDGLSAGNSSSAKASIADITSKEERVSKLGITFAAESLGLIAGPLIGGIFASYGFKVSSFIASGVALLCFLLTLFLFNETRDFSQKSTNKKKKGIDFMEMFIVLKGSITRNLIVMVFMIQFLITMMWGSLALFAKSKFTFGGTEMGYVSAFAATVGILSQTIILKYLTKRIKDKWILFGGLISMGIGMALISWSPVVGFMLAGVGTMACCFNILMPTVTGMISKLSPEEEQGRVMGTVSSSTYLGSLLGPVISTGVYSINIVYPYILSSIIAVTSSFLSLSSKTSKEEG